MNSIAVLSGVLVGFSLGLVGGGGSVLATPLLLYAVVGVPAHVAVGTGAFAVSVNAFFNFLAQVRSGRIVWRSAIIFALVGMTGALIGSTAGKAFNGDALIFLFGLAMLGIGASMLRPYTPTNPSRPSKPLHGIAKTVAIAFLVGCAAGFFGIGGGVLIVPGLVFATGMPMLNAVATSLLAVVSFGATTAVNYAVSGYVNWVIAAQFIGGGLLGGFLGMRAGVSLSRYKGGLNMAFALMTFSVAGYVLYRSGSVLYGPLFTAQRHVAQAERPSPLPAAPAAPADRSRSGVEESSSAAPATEASGPPTARRAETETVETSPVVPPEAAPAAEHAEAHPSKNTKPRGGTEARLRALLATNETPADVVTWLDLDKVRFDPGKTTPRPSSETQLRSVAEILSTHPHARAIVAGNTDNTGDARANRRISRLRAERVLRDLVRMGVDPSRLEAKGYADDRPIASNATEAGRAENRRISLGVVPD